MAAARDGTPYGVQNVTLVQDGDEIEFEKAHAFWMAYQKGQAAKTEQLQAAGAAVDLAPVLDRLTALEGVLEAGGVFHQLFERTKTEIAAFVQDEIAALETRLAPPAAPAPPETPPAPAAEQAQTEQPAEQQPATQATEQQQSAAGAAPQPV
ncbi:type II secretory pathway component HofQ [Bradyrhizobium sp. i1.4.4]